MFHTSSKSKRKRKFDVNIDWRILLYDYFYGQVPVVDLITNIFHRGGIFHTTETKLGHKKHLASWFWCVAINIFGFPAKWKRCDKVSFPGELYINLFAQVLIAWPCVLSLCMQTPTLCRDNWNKLGMLSQQPNAHLTPIWLRAVINMLKATLQDIPIPLPQNLQSFGSSLDRTV